MDLVNIDKRTLHFQLEKPGKDSIVSDTLTVHNISQQHIAFKVKTTNQSRYIVRPNVGMAAPDDKLEIFIGVQPSSNMPSPGASKDKFLLRIAPCEGHDRISNSFWTTHEDNTGMAGLKLRVEFVAPSVASSGSPPLVPHTLGLDNTFMSSPGTPPLSPTFPPDVPASVPHVRDLPPDLLTPTANGGMPTSAPPSPYAESPVYYMIPPPAPVLDDAITSMAAAPRSPAEEEVSLGDPDSLLSEGRYNEAIAKVALLQSMLDDKNLELARLKTELAETRAETDRVLKDAPVPPLAANKVLSDPFGGLSVTGFGLMLLLFLLVVNIVLRLV